MRVCHVAATVFSLALSVASASATVLIREDGGVAWLGIHVALVAFALILAKHNRFAITKC